MSTLPNLVRTSIDRRTIAIPAPSPLPESLGKAEKVRLVFCIQGSSSPRAEPSYPPAQRFRAVSSLLFKLGYTLGETGVPGSGLIGPRPKALLFARRALPQSRHVIPSTPGAAERFQLPEAFRQQFARHVMHQRREPCLPIPSCQSKYSLQRRRRAGPAQGPGRGGMFAIALGCPSLLFRSFIGTMRMSELSSTMRAIGEIAAAFLSHGLISGMARAADFEIIRQVVGRFAFARLLDTHLPRKPGTFETLADDRAF
ncbi:hypothetical protein ABIB90_008498 [Bradyrhizobium sp. JR4.1]